MLTKTLARLSADQQGNFNLVAALMAAPIIGGLMLAYDYARFDMFNQSAVSAIDSALGMMMSDVMESRLSEIDMDNRAKDYLFANLQGGDEAASTVDFVQEKFGNNGTIYKLHVKLVYKPLTGPFASILPAKGKGGGNWIYTQ